MSIILFLIWLFKILSSKLEIYVDKYYLQRTNRAHPENIEIIQEALDKAKNTLEKLIEVQEEEATNIIFSEKFTNDVVNYGFLADSMNSSLVESGVKAHLVILVKLIDDNDNDAEFSSKCIDQIGIIKKNGRGRPIVGYIKVKRQYLLENVDTNTTYQKEYLSSLFLHQFTHLLGFARSVVTENGLHITSTTISRNHNPIQKEIISSPNLLKLAKKYYNCQDSNIINGIELEDANSNNCDEEFIHWDERLLLGDYMTYEINVQEQVISNFTLLLLEETGFYKANYFTGGLMNFGKNGGCDFIKSDCNEVLKTGQTQNTQRFPTFKNEFCSSRTKTTCSPARLSRGLCENLIDSTEFATSSSDYYIYKEYKRTSWEEGFQSINYGNQYADFCPISLNEKEYGSTKKKSYIGNCNLGTEKDYGGLAFYFDEDIKNNSNLTYNYSFFSKSYGEEFGKDSFCAFSSAIHKEDPKQNIYKGFIRPTCYKMSCSDTSLTIKINNQFIVCPKEGGFVSIGGKYMGHIACPDFNLICDKTKICNNLFDCVELGSEEKGLSDNYSKNENVSVQIILPGKNDIFNKSYEESNNGECPKHCSECYENKKCFECSPNYPYHKGEKENDANPITCESEINQIGYYNKSIDNKTYFFKCLDNCLYCNSGDKCNGCAPEYRLGENNRTCEKRIKSCLEYDHSSEFNDKETNGNYPGYKTCLRCDNGGGYYCIDNDKSNCTFIDEKAFYTNENDCKSICERPLPNCYSCSDKDTCIECKENYHINSDHKCLVNIPNCEKHNNLESECDKCKDGYYCLYGDKSQCIEVEDITQYYNTSKDGCFEKCTDKFERCIKCKEDKCEKCQTSYFVHNNTECIKGLDHCINHFYNVTHLFCNECEDNYYCINNIKEVCTYLDSSNISLYYLNDNNCMEKCYKKFSFCLNCDKNDCSECSQYTIYDETKKKCIIDPEQTEMTTCSIKYHELNENINDIILDDYPFNYYKNLKSISVVDHYVNKNYTITVFLNSDCTDDLLNQGYFKIESKELQHAISNEFNVNEKVLFSVFITYNSNSHFRYYSNELTYLDTSEEHSSVNNIEYTITNKYTKNIEGALGLIVSTLIENEKLNLFERDSDIFNDYCKNVTLLGIDIPLKKRLFFLFLHDYSTQLACLGTNCSLEEYNEEESLAVCKCKIGNKFEDILQSNEFIHYEGSEEKVNNFIDSIGIIKCTGNGFNSKNMKANAGLFLALIGMGAQVILFIFNIIFSKSIILPKGLSNPPRKQLMLITDWDKSIKRKNESEAEVYIQPRDDDDEQLLEEEKSYSNDAMDLINISLDTNVEGINGKGVGKSKLSEKPQKRILILLNNKGEKSPKHLKEYEELSSDAEIIKLTGGKNLEDLTFIQIYWSIVSLKQHIINFFSSIHCCKITKSFIPLPMRIIRSIFLVFLSFVFNILFLNQSYYEKKFNHFNDKFKIIHSKDANLEISAGEKISYSLSNTFVYAMISMLLLIIVNFVVGYIFFNIRNKISEVIKNNNTSEINDIASQAKKRSIIFFIINIILMFIFFITITAFVGAYGGGFVDYFVPGIISLIFLEIIPFLWSLILAFLTYLGIKKKIECCSKVSNFFMF